MKKNLKIRSVVIAVTILVCVIGIIDLPKSKQELKQNFAHNIRLGLDLKGGSHLVLQVQVQDAVKADADTTIERLKEDLKKQNITWAGMDRTEPKDISDADRIEISIKGVPATQSSEFESPGLMATWPTTTPAAMPVRIEVQEPGVPPAVLRNRLPLQGVV